MAERASQKNNSNESHHGIGREKEKDVRTSNLLAAKGMNIDLS
jgi:hypothetical protein